MTELLRPAQITENPSLRDMVSTFTYIGVMSFGGPAGQISLMHRIVVEEKRWLSDARFMNALNYCMLLPGPEAQQLATYIGWLMHGKRGGIIAGALFILPGLLCIFALASAYALYLDATWLGASLSGLKAAVLAVILQALINISKKALKTTVHLVIALSAFLALFVFSVPFPLVVLAAGLIGFAMALSKPSASDSLSAQSQAERAVPIQRKSLALMLLVGLCLWQLPLAVLLTVSAPKVLTELHLFFTNMAVVTFGGAYAVLSYVAQVAVDGKAWITADAMLDGLAFAEATPGPLVLVLPFISFLAGFGHAEGWPPFAVALGAGLITTWATFVPSFLFIFLGAPFIERVNAMPRAKAAMSAVTAAVVGVIANLALWFAIGILFGHVTRQPIRLFPAASLPLPQLSNLDPFALAIVLLSLGLMFWLRRSVLFTLGAGLLAGILFTVAVP